MKHVKRTLFLIIAAFMALSPLMSIPARAATLFVEEVSNNITYKGTPTSIVFTTAATYSFEIDFSGGSFTLWQTAPLAGAEKRERVSSATFNTQNQSINVGGLTVFKKPTGGNEEGAWYGKDKFSVTVNYVGDSGEAFLRTAKIMNTSGNEITRVTRNTLVSFELFIVDPRYAANDYRQSSEHFMVTGGSFIQEDIDVPIKVEKTSYLLDGVNRVAFKVTIPKMRYDGTGNTMAFSLVYKGSDGSWRALQYTTEWSQCVEGDYNPTDDWEETENLDPITPYIIVESFNYGGTSVQGGEDFELELVLRNTSNQYTLQNVVMNVTPTGVYNLTSSSNTYYLKNLFAGSTTVRQIKLRADLTTATDSSETPKANAVEIRFTYQYVANSARMSGTSSETITIPVSFPDRLEFNTSELPTNMYVGESYNFYLPIINKGRTSAYNVEATIGGEVEAPGRTVYIGNVNNGDESSIDFDLSFSEPGRKTVDVSISYEDANMNRLTKNVVFVIEVEDMPFWDPGPVDPGLEPPTEPEPQFEIPGSAKVAGIAACALSAYLTVMRAKARRSEYLDEDI